MPVGLVVCGVVLLVLLQALLQRRLQRLYVVLLRIPVHI